MYSNLVIQKKKTESAQFHERLALSARFRGQSLIFKMAMRTGNKQQKGKEKKSSCNLGVKVVQCYPADHFIDSIMVLHNLCLHFVVSKKKKHSDCTRGRKYASKSPPAKTHSATTRRIVRKTPINKKNTVWLNIENVFHNRYKRPSLACYPQLTL